jgi:hypothetical protein
MKEASHAHVVHDRPAEGAMKEGEVTSFLWLVFVVLLVLWLVGVAVNWGAFIWLLLVAGIFVLAANLIRAAR